MTVTQLLRYCHNPSTDPSWRRTGCRRGKCFTQRRATLAPASLGSQPTEHISHHSVKLGAGEGRGAGCRGPIEEDQFHLCFAVCSARARLESRAVICAHGSLQTRDRPFSFSLVLFFPRHFRLEERYSAAFQTHGSRLNPPCVGSTK